VRVLDILKTTTSIKVIGSEAELSKRTKLTDQNEYGSWWSRGSEHEEETDGYLVLEVFVRLRSPLSQYHPVLYQSLV
jgi:hypothetical protein